MVSSWCCAQFEGGNLLGLPNTASGNISAAVCASLGLSNLVSDVLDHVLLWVEVSREDCMVACGPVDQGCLLDIGYLLIRPRAQIRVHEPLRYPFMGPLWIDAPAGQYGKHMGRQACRAGNKLAMGPLRGLGVPANIICTRIWGIDGLGWPSHFSSTH